MHVVYSASAQDSHSLLVACARNVYRNIQCNRYLCTHYRYHERWYVQRASLEGARGSVPKQGLSHVFITGCVRALTCRGTGLRDEPV